MINFLKERKVIGGILMIIGTSIGGGMLALPVANAETGFVTSSLLLIGIWVLMTFSAFLLLEVNLWLPPKSNIISMAEATLGWPGRIFAWTVYLFLLYALLAAYIAGGSDVLGSLVALAIHGGISNWVEVVVFTVIMGWVVHRGMQAVDNLNSLLMFFKLGIFLLLVTMISPSINLSFLTGGHAHYALGTVMVLIISFGYAIIIPSLRVYFNDDVQALRRVLLIGSIIPLVCYIIWDAVIMGVLPRYGGASLAHMAHAGHATTELTAALMSQLQNHWITNLFRSFSAISMLTAFLGVGISLTDFLADGLHINKQGEKGWIVYVGVFLPPLIIVLIYPNAFIEALKFGGIFCALLLILLPALMVWSGRYYCKIARGYEVVGGPLAVSLAAIAGIGFSLIGVMHFWRI